jgi:hypothetical protein
LRLEQTRQSVDTEQVFSAWLIADKEARERFRGTMGWRTLDGRDYLYRSIGNVRKSLGPRSPETEEIVRAFNEGKARVAEGQRMLASRLDQMAPVNRALGLGRIPDLTARVIRGLNKAGLIGKTVMIAGTNALYAYERLAGIHVASGYVATGDVDLLYDARSSLRLIASEVTKRGITGILRTIDRSFHLTGAGSYRAVNDDGFMVDLIKPGRRDALRPSGPDRISGDADDLTAVEIEGLVWLVNSPKVRQTVIDERGYPLEMVVPDPRAFSLHKLWLSRRRDRDPAKARRDEAQARLVAELIASRLPLYSFDEAEALSAIPSSLKSLLPNLLLSPAPPPSSGSSEPNW